ncbi:hypothetical protein DH09_06165 [Bacillaceae bacterium JMAK1]|nr:hypothetical protein DH09_06165 [Bacillaceae bacterium JMAK1]
MKGFVVIALSLLVIGCSTTDAQDRDESLADEGVRLQENDQTIEPYTEQTIAEEFNLDQDTIDQAERERSKSSEITPASITIPTLDINAPIVEVGQLDNGQMGVPDNGDDVGWYEPGTKPGGIGNAVLAGHVDDRTGPAVFFDLDELEEGDSILVTGEDGEELEYVVERLESYPFDDSPVDEIFGSSDTKQLNLITCAGIFDRDVGTHDERLVVYTSLIDDEEDEELQPSSPTELTVQGTLLTWHAVREDHVAGYRIYSVDAEGTETYVASVSQTERKAIQMTDEQENYIIKTIDYFGNESDAENVTVAE